MKTVLLTLTFACCCLKSFEQYPKWIIQFTDKNNSPYSLNDPAAYLSQKAIERRNRYHISIDSTDLPVNPSYIQQVLSKGAVQYLSQSKWLNQILIYSIDSAAIIAINSLPFVSATTPVGYLKNQNNGYERFRETIEPLINFSSVATTTQGDTLAYGAAYNQVHIHNGEFLHEKGYTGDGMTIAILDAGFYHYKTLSAFDSMRIENHVLGEKDFVNFDNSVDEDDAHGMYCLSIIGANVPGEMVGTAPHASFWLLRSENTASEYPIEEHNWVSAAEFADSAGADMITSSLGYFYFDDPSFNHSYADIYANTTTVSKGAAMAVNKGMIVTNSAGNEGNDAWKYIIFPADADSVCAVGAVNNSGQIASFSSYGFPGKVKPDIVSVGAGTTVWGTNDAPVTGSGTSFSNPNINGLIACLWEAFPLYNNMTILNAVYQSSDRYNNPDNRYGFGIPDMEKAYLILKTRQNKELYGNEWLFATPDTFTNRIDIKLIGQVNGNARIILQDANGNVIDTILLKTEQQEVYDTAFIDLDNLSPGKYTVKYTDSNTTRDLLLIKPGISPQDWLAAVPVPFTNQLIIYLRARESGKVSVRLISSAGKILEMHEITVVQNGSYSINFSIAASLSHGVYFVQYLGSEKRTVKVIK